MVDHVRVLGWIGIVRAVLALGLGLYIGGAAWKLGPQSYSSSVEASALPLDLAAFALLAYLCVSFSVLRAVQGVLAVMGRPSARRFGIALAYFDLVNLLLFPVSTALGLYGFVVYRHPQTVFAFSAREGDSPRPIFLALADSLRALLALIAGALVLWVGAHAAILDVPESYLGTQILLLPSWVLSAAGGTLLALGSVWGARAVLAFFPSRLPRLFSRLVAVFDIVLIPFYPLGFWLGVEALGVLPRVPRSGGGPGPT